MQKANHHWEKRLNELTVKKKEAEEDSRKKKGTLTDKMAERTLPEVKSSIKAATCAEVATMAGRVAEDVKVEAKTIEDRFFSDSSLQAIPAEHKDVLVASVGRLLEEQMKTFMKQVDRRIKQAAGPPAEKVDSSDDEEEELLEERSTPDGDGFIFPTGTEKEEKQRKKKEARRAAAANAAGAAAASTSMAVDQEQRKPSEKRTAQDQGGREADVADMENGKAATQQQK